MPVVVPVFFVAPLTLSRRLVLLDMDKVLEALRLPAPLKPVTKEIVSAIARERLAIINGETGLSYAVECAQAMINAARSGDTGALNLLLDRVEGKVPQPQQISGADNGPLQIEIVRFED